VAIQVNKIWYTGAVLKKRSVDEAACDMQGLQLFNYLTKITIEPQIKEHYEESNN
jgi:hypothetical protein